ncbi:MAG TPA: hypothetical protein VF098_06325 [Sphingomicrobium sp.]
MKQWFPLTDYDFYAYLISGMLLIGAVDYTLAGGALVQKSQWTVAEGLFWVAIAYLFGNVLAAPSAAVLEHLLARKLMDSPADVQLGLRERGRFERLFAGLFAPREYAPLMQSIQAKALDRAARETGLARDCLNGEMVFQAAFHPVRQSADTTARLSVFLNQYGFSRNVAFASFLAFVLFVVQEIDSPTRLSVLLLCSSAALSFGMFGRFIKFYAAYSADVLRSYATLPISVEEK